MSFRYTFGSFAAILALAPVGCGTDSAKSSGGGANSGTGATDGSGGTALGGGGGAGPSQIFLGRACETDVDCGELLRCLSLPSDGGVDEVPAGGYCTIPCETQAGCAGFAPNASCRELVGARSYCVLGCEFGPAALGDKCHGRRDVACVATEDESSSACMPRCNDDSQCCADAAPCGLYCDPATGLCGTTVAEGLPIGAPCEGPSDAACRGSCVSISADSRHHVCSEFCTFGSFPACGWRPSEGPAPAYCHFATEVVDALGRAAGDAGLCAQLCDCDDDCDAALGCEPFADEGDVLATQRLGVCTATASSSIPCGVGGAGGGGGQSSSRGGAEPSAGTSFGGVAAGGELSRGDVGGGLVAGGAGGRLLAGGVAGGIGIASEDGDGMGGTAGSEGGRLGS